MAKTPPGKRHKLQDAAKPLEDFNRLARKRLGLPPLEKRVNPSRRRWLPPLLVLLFAVACLIGFGFQYFRGRGAVVPSPRPLVVSFLNVGQGDSTLIQTPSGKNILIDTGPPGYSPALFNELKQRNVKSLDLLIISHYARDHTGNALVVINNFPIGKVVESGLDRFDLTKLGLSLHSEDFKDFRTLLTYIAIYKSNRSKRKRKSYKYEMEHEIMRREIPLVMVAQNLVGIPQDLGDGVTLSYLAPKERFKSPNDNSVILKVGKGRMNFLLMGDTEQVERYWLLNSSQDIEATGLKVAHHGARNGTDDTFLERVKPKIAAISCGRNDYGQPDVAVLNALERNGVKLCVPMRKGQSV